MFCFFCCANKKHISKEQKVGVVGILGNGKNSKLSVSLRKDRASLPRESPGSGMEEAEAVSMNMK